MYAYTGDTAWSAHAEAWTAPQAENQFNATTHDIGFNLLPSYGLGYRLTRNASYRSALLNGAASLASRFNANVGCIRSWDWGDWQYPVIIDNMMNLELLFYGAELGGEPEWTELGLSHALKTMQNHVRPDGGTFHVVDYEPSTGAVLSRGTYQGAADSSTWARGQAWAIYGFAMAYRYTHDIRLLETAEKVADYFIGHLPSDAIPYWDFQAPGIPDTNRDSSAAAIAASGLQELAAFGRGSSRAKYRRAAEAMLRTLSSDDYLALDGTSPGILLHAVGGFPFNSEVDVSLIYGDYYYVQALLRSASGRVHAY
jgi:unsaturated chondroitin disaccharide hydrolase